MSKELATLIEDASKCLSSISGQAQYAKECIKDYERNIPSKEKLIAVNNALAYVRHQAERLAEIEEKLRNR